MVHGLSCSAARGIFLDQGSNRVSFIGGWILYHKASGEAPTALSALCKAAESETISSSSIIKEPKGGGALNTAEGAAAGLCLPLDAHY